MAQGSVRPVAPVKARARGPVQITLEATIGLFFVAFTAWFMGLMSEVAGHHLFWKSEGAYAHSARITQQDLDYILAAPRSLAVGDTEAFARKVMATAAAPYRMAGLVAAYERFHADAPPARGATHKGPLGEGLKSVTRQIFRSASYWAMVSLHVAQDVALRLSVALFALPAFALAVLIGAVDGLVRRDLRRWRGGRESSFIYHHAKQYTVWALTGGFGFYLMWPLGGFNPAYMVLIFTVLVAVVLSTAVASFKKYA